MDPFTATVVSLLSLGAGAVGKGVADEAIKDAYAALKRFVVSKFAKAEHPLAMAEEPDAGPEETDAIAKRVPELDKTDDLKTLVADLQSALKTKADEPELKALIEARKLHVVGDALFDDIVTDRPIIVSDEATFDKNLTVKGYRSAESQKKI